MCGPRGLQGRARPSLPQQRRRHLHRCQRKAGVSDNNGYYGLTALFVDVNNDGKSTWWWPNDSTPNYLYINKGDGTFEDDSYASGFALNEDGRETASMGIAARRLPEQRPGSISTTRLSPMTTIPLYRTTATRNFTDVSYPARYRRSHHSVSWLGRWLSRLRQRWLERSLSSSTATSIPASIRSTGERLLLQRPLLFHNLGEGKFEVIPAVKGTGLAEIIVGRGAAFGDLSMMAKSTW